MPRSAAMQICPSSLQELGHSKGRAMRPGFVGCGSSEPRLPALFGSERPQSLYGPISPRFKLSSRLPWVAPYDGVSSPFDEPRAGRGHRGGLTGYQCRIYPWKSTAPRRGTIAEGGAIKGGSAAKSTMARCSGREHPSGLTFAPSTNGRTRCVPKRYCGSRTLFRRIS